MFKIAGLDFGGIKSIAEIPHLARTNPIPIADGQPSVEAKVSRFQNRKSLFLIDLYFYRDTFPSKNFEGNVSRYRLFEVNVSRAGQFEVKLSLLGGGGFNGYDPNSRTVP